MKYNAHSSIFPFSNIFFHRLKTNFLSFLTVPSTNWHASNSHCRNIFLKTCGFEEIEFLDFPYLCVFCHRITQNKNCAKTQECQRTIGCDRHPSVSRWFVVNGVQNQGIPSSAPPLCHGLQVALGLRQDSDLLLFSKITTSKHRQIFPFIIPLFVNSVCNLFRGLKLKYKAIFESFKCNPRNKIRLF